MHLNENCTKRSKVALDGTQQLGQNELPLCNLCVVMNRRDKLKETANTIRKPEAVNDQMIKALQAKFNEKKKTNSEIKEVVKKKKSGMPDPASIPKSIETPKREPKE